MKWKSFPSFNFVIAVVVVVVLGEWKPFAVGHFCAAVSAVDIATVTFFCVLEIGKKAANSNGDSSNSSKKDMYSSITQTHVAINISKMDVVMNILITQLL